MRVWRGELKKTSGGLTKEMLMKNKRGKIVSKKKSEGARKNKENNLGQWLRTKGDHFLSKGLKKENVLRKGRPGRKPFKQVAEAPAPKPAAKAKVEPAAPKRQQPKPKPKPKAKPPLAPKKPRPATPKKAKKGLTHSSPIKPGDKKSTNISVGNIMSKKEWTRSELRNYMKKLTKYQRLKKKKDWILSKIGPPPPGVKI